MLSSKDDLSGRARNARGEGQRLRAELLEAATELLAKLGSAESLTLRAVAREVGVAPASIYGHFEDLDGLVAQVLTERYAELAAQTEAATAGASSALDRLVARCWAYARWGVEHPGHYRVVFGGRVERESPLSGGSGGLALLHGLTTALHHAAEPSRRSGTEVDGDVNAGLLLWAGLHGVISLRIDKPGIAWPVLDVPLTRLVVLHSGRSMEQVTASVERLGVTGGARSPQPSAAPDGADSLPVGLRRYLRVQSRS